MAESKFQSSFLKKVKQLFPDCMVLKNDPNYIQGIQDWTILYNDTWALLEMKDYEGAPCQPNQPYYVEKANNMSYSRFVYPENEKIVLEELKEYFNN